ncbi:hypothetical protein BC833DRAFT_213686 [Globomyces pollinis-pini]|nr:hypothetical protein BC833DRAFT_213686 [Globomyces pollinis-pini]
MKNLQQAGFKTVLIYNQPRRLPHELVRMSIHSDKLIKSRGIFMSREDGMDLKTRYNSQQVTTITIKHVEELQVQQRLYWKMARDMFIQFVLVFLNVYGFFLMLISFNMVQNYCDNGSVQFLDSLQEAISLILNPDFDFTETLPQTLEYNTLPERQITELDLQTEWKEGGIKGQDVCPICLDQFVINDTARDLPCRHVFHDTW